MRLGLRMSVFPALFIALVAAPLFLGVLVAVLYASGLMGLGNAGPTIAIWWRVLGAPDLWWSLAWSVVMSAMAIGASSVMALFAIAFRLDTRLLAILMAFPGTVTAFLVFQFGGSWLVKDAWGMGMLLAHVAVLAPFLSILFSQTSHAAQLPALQDMARMCGVRGRSIHVHVTVPVLAHRLRFHIMLLFIAFAGSFEIPLLLGRSWPETVSVLAFNRYARFSLETRPEAFAIVVVYMTLVCGLFAFAWKKGWRDVS